MNEILIKAIVFVGSMVCLALIGVGVYVLIDYWMIYIRERIRLRMNGEKDQIVKRVVTISGADLINRKAFMEMIQAEIRDAELDGKKDYSEALQKVYGWLTYMPVAKLTLEEERKWRTMRNTSMRSEKSAQ